MIIRKDKKDTIRCVKLFGWRIYITRDKLRRKDPDRAKFRTKNKKRRLIRSGHRCELCGTPIDIKCTLFHMLPKGCDGRNDVPNIRVICWRCKEHTDRVGGFRPMIEMQEGGEL